MRPSSAGGRKGVIDAQALPARKDAAAPSAARPRTSDRASGRGSARRLRSTLYWQAAVGFDATPQARPRARTALHGLYRHPRVGTAISRESGRHQDFGLPAKAIAGPDLATVWRNSRSRTAKPSSIPWKRVTSSLRPSSANVRNGTRASTPSTVRLSGSIRPWSTSSMAKGPWKNACRP